ncbi:zinc transporter 1 [Gracilaria domingensis]|nr:zinc transporter 1 [Gracilaria domingensis]
MVVVECTTVSLTILGVFLIALSGSLAPVLFASPAIHVRVLRLGNSFSAGFLVAAALVHILPEALIKLANNHSTEFPWGGFLTLVGVSSVYVLDVLARRIQRGSDNTLPVHSHNAYSRAHSPAVAIVLATSLSFHSFLEGVSLGVSLLDVASFTALSLAILVHKFFAALALGSTLTASADGDSKLQKHAIYWCIFFSSVTPFGAMIGMILLEMLPDHINALSMPALTLVSAGVFLYVALVELLAEEFRYASKDSYTDMNPDDSLLSMAVFVFAAGAMSLLALWT